MRRPLRPDELRLWSAVAHTVRPAHGRVMPSLEDLEPVADKPATAKTKAKGKASPAPAPVPSAPTTTPYWRAHLAPVANVIEPGRKRRITRERDPIEARIDLHGMGQFDAEDRLKAFLFRAQDAGLRAVLVITGKGISGDGVIRRRAPDWLADPMLRSVVAGISQAHPRHGGDGALYVALKRRVIG